MQSYSETMKSKLVQRMLPPEAKSIRRISSETGISESALYKWRQAARIDGMTKQSKITVEAKRPEDWSAVEKLSAVVESTSLKDEDLGAFLRSRGLHEAQLSQWQESALLALGSGRVARGASADQRRVRELEKELLRKDKALAEAAALLILQKKVQALWGDTEDDTSLEIGRV
jgi:transposase